MIEPIDPLFTEEDKECRQGLILYCEGRFQDDLKCVCVPKNQIEFINF